MTDSTAENRNAPRKPHFNTLAAHAGASGVGGADVVGGDIPTVKPIYLSTTFLAPSIGEMDQVFSGERPGYVYGRYANPTSGELERAVAVLEGGEPDNTVSFASGMSALHSAMLASGLSAGDTVVASGDLYGQTYTLLNGQMRQLGIDTTFIDATNLNEAESAIRQVRPRLVLTETISNPLVRVAQMPGLVTAAHEVGALILVDNTFATPYLVNPFQYGADIVVHSATKFLSGHGDTMGGIAIGATQELGDALRRVRRDTGGVISPHDAWLITRGIRTLPLRVQRQCDNAMQVALWLGRQDAVEGVNYPGLGAQPLKELYGTDAGGAMLSFVLRDYSKADVFTFMERLTLVTPATTLGDLSTLILYPAMSSHRWLTEEVRNGLGISEGLVRLSVGVEEVTDILADLEQAFRPAHHSGGGTQQ